MRIMRTLKNINESEMAELKGITDAMATFTAKREHHARFAELARKEGLEGFEFIKAYWRTRRQLH